MLPLLYLEILNFRVNYEYEWRFGKLDADRLTNFNYKEYMFRGLKFNNRAMELIVSRSSVLLR